VGAAGLHLHRRQRMVDCDGDVRGCRRSVRAARCGGRCSGHGDCQRRRETGAQGREARSKSYN
jgi:hypothetical protein